MNATIRGRAAIWGIVAEAGDTFAAGLILDQGKVITGEEDFIYDNDGNTITEVFFDDRDECDINIICEDTTTDPVRGDDIAIVGDDCIVQSAELKWKQKGWKVLNVKAKKFSQLVEA
jgi:hypothetical protein